MVGWKELRDKWVEVPGGLERTETSSLLALSEDELRRAWLRARQSVTTGEQFSHRGWYYALYVDWMHDKKVIDIGCGLGLDGITFAIRGAEVTFVDLVESNLEVVRRIADSFDLDNVDFLLLENIGSLERLPDNYDVIYAQGSMHHAPQEIIKPEVQELLRHLVVGGRWIQLAYPKERWIKDGKPSFSKWGEHTDGSRTPWAEWYDLSKLLKLLEPAKFKVVLCQNFHHDSFIWFDLLRYD